TASSEPAAESSTTNSNTFEVAEKKIPAALPLANKNDVPVLTAKSGGQPFAPPPKKSDSPAPLKSSFGDNGFAQNNPAKQETEQKPKAAPLLNIEKPVGNPAAAELKNPVQEKSPIAAAPLSKSFGGAPNDIANQLVTKGNEVNDAAQDKVSEFAGAVQNKLGDLAGGSAQEKLKLPPPKSFGDSSPLTEKRVDNSLGNTQLDSLRAENNPNGLVGDNPSRRNGFAFNPQPQKGEVPAVQPENRQPAPQMTPPQNPAFAQQPNDRPINNQQTLPAAAQNSVVTNPAAGLTPFPAKSDDKAGENSRPLVQNPPPMNLNSPRNATLPTTSGLDNRAMNVSSSSSTRGTPGDAKLDGLQTPSLAIEKIAPEEIQVNQVAKFKIAVRNVGRVTATDVVVSDQIPAGTELITSTPPATQRTSDGKIQWSLGQMAPGDEHIIDLDLRPSRPGEIGSVAQVTFSTQASMRTRVTRPELAVEHSGPPRTMVGGNVPLKIVVHNRGDGPATDVLLQERVPAQLKYADEFRDLEYPIGTIPPGKSKEVTLNLTAAEAGRFRNVVMVTGAGNLQAQHEIDMEVVAPKLQGNIQGPNRRFLKREATHTFTATNSGSAAATNVDIAAKLPRGVQFVSANNRGQYDAGSHSIYWSLAELTPGQTAEVAITTLPIETGNHEVEFRATADLQQSVSTRQQLAIEHLVDVYFEIDDVDDHIEVGGTTRYRIRIVNQGTKPANNVKMDVEMA
ncbi:MAG: hypothetical protein ABL888_22660, partial [Pirellulaceae bacterium]